MTTYTKHTIFCTEVVFCLFHVSPQTYLIFKKPGAKLNKILFIVIFAMSLVSCSVMPNKNIKLSDENDISIVGIWAMLPLHNGIANVVEFTKEGKSNLYPFNCKEKSSDEVESSTYKINDDGRKIRLDSKGAVQNLNVVSLKGNAMVLSTEFEDASLEFSYIRTSRISPLCFLYKEPDEDKSKGKAFKETDFIHAPWIPDNPNITRYAGKWADEKGVIQIEVKKDADGKYKIFHESDENWNYLYNNVHWSGVELNFQSFAYSDKHDLFDHPYHKSSSITMLTPIDDLNKIKWSFFIDAKRFDFILNRK